MSGKSGKEAEPGSKTTVQSVERTFDVLESLAQAHRLMAISELSQKLGLHISTVHRLLATLIERGYARRDEATGKYGIGSRLLELAGSLSEQVDLRQEARPILEKLAVQVGETSNLSVRSGPNLVYIDQVQSARLVRMFTRVGSSAPLYCTGSGKLFLAYLTPANLEHYLQTNRLEPRTKATLTSAEALRQELQAIRERGYSFDSEEMEDGVVCVAAPIFDRQSEMVAAMSISGPTSRLATERLPQIVEQVCQSAAEVSTIIGYRAS